VGASAWHVPIVVIEKVGSQQLAAMHPIADLLSDQPGI
jgi:hypothetical protein